MSIRNITGELLNPELELIVSAEMVSDVTNLKSSSRTYLVLFLVVTLGFSRRASMAKKRHLGFAQSLCPLLAP